MYTYGEFGTVFMEKNVLLLTVAPFEVAALTKNISWGYVGMYRALLSIVQKRRPLLSSSHTSAPLLLLATPMHLEPSASSTQCFPAWKAEPLLLTSGSRTPTSLTQNAYCLSPVFSEAFHPLSRYFFCLQLALLCVLLLHGQALAMWPVVPHL